MQAKKQEKFEKLSDQTEREEEEGFQIIYYQLAIFTNFICGAKSVPQEIRKGNK